MRETMIVMRRELRHYFSTPIAYVFGVMFLLVVSGLASLATLYQTGPASLYSSFRKDRPKLVFSSVIIP